MEAADRLGLRTALARAQLYDTRESVDRVKCMRRIAATGNDDLHGPLTFTVYGATFTIE